MSTLVIPNQFINGAISDAVAVNQNFAAVVKTLNGGLDSTNFSTGAIPTALIARDHGFKTGHVADAAVTTGKLAPRVSVENRSVGDAVFNTLSSTVETIYAQTSSMSWSGGRVHVGGGWSMVWTASVTPISGTLLVKAYRRVLGVDTLLFGVSYAVSMPFVAGSPAIRLPVPMPEFIDVPPQTPNQFVIYKITVATSDPNLFVLTGPHAGVITAEEAA